MQYQRAFGTNTNYHELREFARINRILGNLLLG